MVILPFFKVDSKSNDLYEYEQKKTLVAHFAENLFQATSSTNKGTGQRTGNTSVLQTETTTVRLKTAQEDTLPRGGTIVASTRT